MKELKVGVDFDGVIADDAVLKAWVLRDKFDLDLLPAACKRLVLQGHLSDDEIREFQRIVFTSMDLIDRMPAVENALVSMRVLQEAGHAVRIITSRSEAMNSLQTARAWLESQGADFDITGCGVGVSKAEAAKDCDVFIDDDPHKLFELNGVVPNRFLFWTERNACDPVAAGIIRVRCWSELMAHIDEIQS